MSPQQILELQKQALQKLFALKTRTAPAPLPLADLLAASQKKSSTFALTQLLIMSSALPCVAREAAAISVGGGASSALMPTLFLSQ